MLLCGAGQGQPTPGWDHPCPTTGHAQPQALLFLRDNIHPLPLLHPPGPFFWCIFSEVDPASGQEAAPSPSPGPPCSKNRDVFGTRDPRLSHRPEAVTHLPWAAVPFPGIEEELSSMELPIFPWTKAEETWGKPSSRPVTQIKTESIKVIKAGSWQEPKPRNSLRKPLFPEQVFPVLVGTGECIPHTWSPAGYSSP